MIKPLKKKSTWWSIDGFELGQIKNDNDIGILYKIPAQRYNDFVEYINPELDNLDEILSNWNPLLSSYDTSILFTDESNGSKYGIIPGESAETKILPVSRKAQISISPQDPTALCHELAHIYDHCGTELKSESQEFQNLISDLKPKISQVYQLLRDAGYYSYETNDDIDATHNHELKYTCDKELFAIISNDWYCRTHEENSFANVKKPIISEIVVDYLYTTNERFRNQVTEYCESIYPWLNPHLETVIERNFISETTWMKLDEVLELFTQESEDPLYGQWF